MFNLCCTQVKHRSVVRSIVVCIIGPPFCRAKCTKALCTCNLTTSICMNWQLSLLHFLKSSLGYMCTFLKQNHFQGVVAKCKRMVVKYHKYQNLLLCGQICLGTYYRTHHSAPTHQIMGKGRENDVWIFTKKIDPLPYVPFDCWWRINEYLWVGYRKLALL